MFVLPSQDDFKKTSYNKTGIYMNNDYLRVKRILNDSGVLASDRDFLHGYNKIRRHSQFESLEHFISKAMLAFLVMKKGKVVITEADMRNGRCIDILQVVKDNLVGYEIESDKNWKDGVDGIDIVEVKISEMPIGAREGIKALSRWLQEFII
jgi:hypothetical protein